MVRLDDFDFAELVYRTALELREKAFERGQNPRDVLPIKVMKKAGRTYALLTYGRSFDSWKRFLNFDPRLALFRSTVITFDGYIDDAAIVKGEAEPDAVFVAFTKFPNLGEDPYVEKLAPKRAYRKVDGSLVAVSFDPTNETLLIRSKGGWENFVVDAFEHLLNEEKLWREVKEMAMEFNTVMFELVCDVPREVLEGMGVRVKGAFAETPHSALAEESDAVCYEAMERGRVKAYLLGARAWDGALVPPEDVLEKAKVEWKWMPWRLDEGEGWEAFIEEVKKKPDEEGVVVWADGETPCLLEGPGGCALHVDPLVKVKNKAYLIFVTMKGRFDVAVRHALNGFRDDLLVTDEGKHAVEVADEIERIVSSTIVEAYRRLKELPKEERIKGAGKFAEVFLADDEESAKRRARYVLSGLVKHHEDWEKAKEKTLKRLQRVERFIRSIGTS